jgi:hypothetical protein
MNPEIPLVMLLREDARTPAAIRQARQIAHTLGFDCTSEGSATLSARLREDRFEALFGEVPSPVPGRKAGPSDGGSPAGFGEASLAVPEPLRELVESISVSPPATRFL